MIDTELHKLSNLTTIQIFGNRKTAHIKRLKNI